MIERTTCIDVMNDCHVTTKLPFDSGAVSLSAYAGKSIQLRFTFDSKDSYANAYTGWLLDDVVVTK
jgi:hypothetical protein